MAVPPHHFDEEPLDAPVGGLLGELERRQDDVLSQLDDLDAKLNEVLKGLEPALRQGESMESIDADEDLDWGDDVMGTDSADDWA